MNREELMEIAKDEVEEIVDCLLKFNQKSESCSECSSKDFCDFLKKKMDEETEG